MSPEGTRSPAEPELAPGVSHRSLLLPPRAGSLGNSAQVERVKAETLSAGVQAAESESTGLFNEFFLFSLWVCWFCFLLILSRAPLWEHKAFI